MTQLTSLEAAYQTLKTGTLWSATGKCRGYAAANPGEAKQIDAYVAALVAGSDPVPPVLATATGQGIVGLIAAGFPYTPTVTSHLGLIHEGGGVATYATKIGSYGLVVVSLDDTTLLNSRTLVYANGCTIRNDGGSGVSFAEAQQLGYLTAVPNPKYPGTYADVKNPAYQAWFAQQMVAYAKAQAAAGVFLDDVAVWPATGVVLPGYTQPVYQAGMAALVAATGAALKANGLYLAINSSAYMAANQGGGTNPGQGNDAAADIAWAQQNAPHVDAIMQESWMTTSDGTNRPRVTGPDWDQEAQSWITLPAAVEAAGADFIGLTYGPESNALYGYAALLTTCKRPGSVFMWGADTDPVGLVGLYTGTASVDLAAGTGAVS